MLAMVLVMTLLMAKEGDAVVDSFLIKKEWGCLKLLTKIPSTSASISWSSYRPMLRAPSND